MIRTIFAVAIASILLAGCSADRGDPAQVVRDYYRAMDEENVELYYSTVSGARADIAGVLLEKFFSEYDVTYNIDTLFIVSQTGDKAQVLCRVTSLDAGGPKKFHDNRLTILSKLRYRNGRWTIYDAETDKPVLLDGSGQSIASDSSDSE